MDIYLLEELETDTRQDALLMSRSSSVLMFLHQLLLREKGTLEKSEPYHITVCLVSWM